MRTRQMFPNILRSLGLGAALIGALASSAFAQTLNVTDDTYTDDQNPFQPMGADPAIRVATPEATTRPDSCASTFRPCPRAPLSHKPSSASL
jgi:hypothetical protein